VFFECNYREGEFFDIHAKCVKRGVPQRLTTFLAGPLGKLLEEILKIKIENDNRFSRCQHHLKKIFKHSKLLSCKFFTRKHLKYERSSTLSIMIFNSSTTCR